MLRLLIDHNFKEDILRGLLLRVPNLDAKTAREVSLDRTPDPELLAWAAKEGRIIVTHDIRTMPGHAADRMAAGETVAGVIIVPQLWPIGRSIDELELLVVCTEPSEWENLVRHLPV
jgi:hypothetical protein